MRQKVDLEIKTTGKMDFKNFKINNNFFQIYFDNYSAISKIPVYSGFS